MKLTVAIVTIYSYSLIEKSDIFKVCNKMINIHIAQKEMNAPYL